MCDKFLVVAQMAENQHVRCHSVASKEHGQSPFLRLVRQEIWTLRIQALDYALALDSSMLLHAISKGWQTAQPEHEDLLG